MSDLEVSGGEDAVSGGEDAVSDWGQSVSGGAPNSLSQACWNFGSTVGELNRTSDGRLCVCVKRLKDEWVPNEWSVDEFDEVFSKLLPADFEPELETEKFCFFEKEQQLFLQVIGKDGTTYFIHPDTNTVLKKKQVSP